MGDDEVDAGTDDGATADDADPSAAADAVADADTGADADAVAETEAGADADAVADADTGADAEPGEAGSSAEESDDDTEAVGAEAVDPEGTTGSTSPMLFLLGLLGFLGSLLAFVADLLTDYDVLRSVLVNAGSVVVLVFWAARDTLTDPESSVDSTGGAAGTALLLLGLYLLGAAAVVGVTSLVHDRFDLVPWAAGVGVALVVVGYVVLPKDAILAESDEPATNSEGEDKPDS